MACPGDRDDEYSSVLTPYIGPQVDKGRFGDNWLTR